MSLWNSYRHRQALCVALRQKDGGQVCPFTKRHTEIHRGKKLLRGNRIRTTVLSVELRVPSRASHRDPQRKIPLWNSYQNHGALCGTPCPQKGITHLSAILCGGEVHRDHDALRIHTSSDETHREKSLRGTRTRTTVLSVELRVPNRASHTCPPFCVAERSTERNPLWNSYPYVQALCVPLCH
jgi:hypothetical protein